jgi:hypothetical protein
MAEGSSVRTSLDALVLEFRDVNDVSTLGSLGSLFPEVRERLSTPNRSGKRVVEFFDAKAYAPFQFTSVQEVAVGLTLPLHENPGLILDYLCAIFPDTAQLPSKYKLGIAIRIVRAAILANRVRDLLQRNFIQNLMRSDERLFQLPFLFLSAHTSPIVCDPHLSGDGRLDSMVFYYSGVNKLLLPSSVESADADFVRAWRLSRFAKDMRPAILHVMGLSAFLLGKSPKQFQARVGRKYVPTAGLVRDLWDLNKKLEAIRWSNLFKEFLVPIRRERARRMLLLIARTVEAARLADLRKYCEYHGIDELVPNDELELRIVGDVVYFGTPRATARIDLELAAVALLAADIAEQH